MQTPLDCGSAFDQAKAISAKSLDLHIESPDKSLTKQHKRDRRHRPPKPNPPQESWWINKNLWESARTRENHHETGLRWCSGRLTALGCAEFTISDCQWLLIHTQSQVVCEGGGNISIELMDKLNVLLFSRRRRLIAHAASGCGLLDGWCVTVVFWRFRLDVDAEIFLHMWKHEA